MHDKKTMVDLLGIGDRYVDLHGRTAVCRWSCAQKVVCSADLGFCCLAHMHDMLGKISRVLP